MFLCICSSCFKVWNGCNSLYFLQFLEGTDFEDCDWNREKMLRRYLLAVVVLINVLELARASLCTDGGKPHRILLDTDVDTDDLLGLLYLLKLNRSEFNVEVSSDETHKLFQR